VSVSMAVPTISASLSPTLVPISATPVAMADKNISPTSCKQQNRRHHTYAGGLIH
jgi:hypothetical protein